MNSPIIIIGAGIGGLSAAIRLAAAGQRVLVFEQNDAVGGKMGEVALEGFRWDTGPSVITMRPEIEELFGAAGRRLEDYLKLSPVEPLTRYFFADGRSLDTFTDRARMTEQIAAIEPDDVKGYFDFLTYAERIYKITSPVFIRSDPPALASLRSANPFDLLRIDPWLTLHQAVGKRVRSPQMQMVLDRYATYVGASPYLAPATLAVIAHVELQGGVWYPQGGVYQIAYALWRLAIEMGVEVHTSAPVRAITLHDHQVVGVELQDGARVPASAVLSNVDVTRTYRTLLPQSDRVLRRRRRLAQQETSCSGFIMLLGLEGETPALAHHNVFFPQNYALEFEDIFTRRIPPEEPALYIAITSKSDPAHAPPGCENWFVLVNAPAISDAFDWRYNADDYAEHILDRLAATGNDVRARVRVRRTFTPLEIERATGAWHGALYGISSNHAMNAFRRPHNRSPDVKGLYFAGGTTHPGGGVPLAMLSGKVAARMIIEDLLPG